MSKLEIVHSRFMDRRWGRPSDERVTEPKLMRAEAISPRYLSPSVVIAINDTAQMASVTDIWATFTVFVPTNLSAHSLFFYIRDRRQTKQKQE